jgi:hypothetical protein
VVKLITEIKNIIKEELSISDEVLKAKKTIISAIIKDSKAREKEVSPIANYVKRGQFNEVLFEKDYLVKYEVYYVNNDWGYKYVLEKCPGGYSNSSEIFIHLVYVKEKNQYIDVVGDAQHELGHIYQAIRKNKWLLSNKLTGDIYKKACDLKNNGTTLAEQLVGYTLYYNNNFERDAFANGTYSMMVDNNVTEPIKYLKQTVNFQNVLAIERVLETGNYKEGIDAVAKSAFGKSYAWWANIARRMVSTYKVKMGKVIAKYQKEYLSPDKKLIGNNKKIGDFE